MLHHQDLEALCKLSTRASAEFATGEVLRAKEAGLRQQSPVSLVESKGLVLLAESGSVGSLEAHKDHLFGQS